MEMITPQNRPPHSLDASGTGAVTVHVVKDPELLAFSRVNTFSLLQQQSGQSEILFDPFTLPSGR